MPENFGARNELIAVRGEMFVFESHHRIKSSRYRDLDFGERVGKTHANKPGRIR